MKIRATAGRSAPRTGSPDSSHAESATKSTNLSQRIGGIGGVPPHFTPEILRTIEEIALISYDEVGYDNWCETVCEVVGEYLLSLGIGYFIDWSGASFDGTHTFIRLKDGWIVDPTITQFRDAPRASKKQREAVAGFPHHPAAPLVAVIPESHALYREYGGHFRLHSDDDLEELGIGRPYDIRRWTPKTRRTRAKKPHPRYRDTIERATGRYSDRGRR